MGENEPTTKKQWDELEERLKAILAASDLSQLTTKGVRKQLESEFGLTLGSSTSKAWIKEKINAFAEESAAGDEPDEPAPAAPAGRKRKAREAGADGDAADVEIEEDPSHPPISDELAAILGVRRATRFRVIKLLWVYIKKHGLQDASDKRYILCDAKLKKFFGGTARIHTFTMSKYIGPHLLPKEGKEEEAAESGEEVSEDEDDEAAPKPRKAAKSAAKPASKRSPSGGSAYKGTPELAEFCGEETNNRFVITKHLWAHIKANGLQNPSDKRRIMCDATLKRLFKVDEMTTFSMSKHVSAHFP